MPSDSAQFAQFYFERTNRPLTRVAMAWWLAGGLFLGAVAGIALPASSRRRASISRGAPRRFRARPPRPPRRRNGSAIAPRAWPASSRRRGSKSRSSTYLLPKKRLSGKRKSFTSAIPGETPNRAEPKLGGL